MVHVPWISAVPWICAVCWICAVLCSWEPVPIQLAAAQPFGDGKGGINYPGVTLAVFGDQGGPGSASYSGLNSQSCQPQGVLDLVSPLHAGDINQAFCSRLAQPCGLQRSMPGDEGPFPKLQHRTEPFSAPLHPGLDGAGTPLTMGWGQNLWAPAVINSGWLSPSKHAVASRLSLQGNVSILAFPALFAWLDVGCDVGRVSREGGGTLGAN